MTSNMTGVVMWRRKDSAAVSGYANEKWIKLYEGALLELSHALLVGRIAETRAEIVNRIGILRQLPGLHREERQAIDVALRGLRFLEKQEVRYAKDEQQVIQHALEKLRSIARAVYSVKPDTPPAE